MRKLVVSASAAVLFAVGVIVPTTSSLSPTADEASTEPEGFPSSAVQGAGMYDPSGEEREDDATLTAREQGAGDGMSALSAQSLFLNIIGEIEEKYGDSFVGASLGTVDDPDVWIGFTEEPDGYVVDLVDSAPFPIDLRWGQGFSQAELAQALDLSMAIASKIVPEGVALAGSAVPGFGMIEITYAAGKGSEERHRMERDVLDEVSASFADEGLFVPVKIEYDSSIYMAAE